MRRPTTDPTFHHPPWVLQMLIERETTTTFDTLTATADALVDLIEASLFTETCLQDAEMIMRFAVEEGAEEVVFRRAMEELDTPYDVLGHMAVASSNPDLLQELIKSAILAGDQELFVVEMRRIPGMRRMLNRVEIPTSIVPLTGHIPQLAEA